MTTGNHGDECSFSGSAFPSLKLIHSQEDECIIDGTTTISGEIDSIFIDTYKILDACGMVGHDGIQNLSSDDENCDGHPKEDGYTLDGYPTDERTIESFYQMKEKERLGLNILHVARKNRATKKNAQILGGEKNVDDSYFAAIVDAEHITKEDAMTSDGDPNVDDSSFLANVEVEDAEIRQPPEFSNRERYVFGFSFLTTNNGEIVEEQPDDSSFIVDAGVEDVSDDFRSIGQSRAGTAVDSFYDVRASTLSRASASDNILMGSNMRNYVGINRSCNSNTADKGQVDEDQSASAYSYGRAYADTGTLASNYTSTLSALTGETLFYALRTGMSEAIKASPIQEGPSFESGETSQNSKLSRGEIKRFQSRCDKSSEESLARPPPLYPSDQATDFLTYENPGHLKMMISYGEGGYVDEEAARIFTSSDRPNGANGDFCWLTSSSRIVKLCVIFSVILMITSVTSLALAFLLPEQFIFTGKDEQIQQGRNSSGQIDVVTMASTNSSQSEANSVTLLDDCGDGAMCSIEGSRCTDGTTESCCGESFYSFLCYCANVNGKLQYNTCIFTNACLAPSCKFFEP